jgi:dethiobiotin synthetase
MNGVLVTGTDTGVGKTVVACALTSGLVRTGLRVAVWKPAETGWDPSSAERLSDAARLREASGSAEPLEAICRYRLSAPLAPAIAARLQGLTVDLVELGHAYRRRASGADAVIVEGAGGLLVPLSGRTTYADLARDLGLRVLIVAANRLGAINHTALTARVATSEGASVIGFVLNVVSGASASRDPRTSPAATDVSTETNRGAIAELTGLPCLGEIPHDPELARDPSRAARLLDLAAIRSALAPAR